MVGEQVGDAGKCERGGGGGGGARGACEQVGDYACECEQVGVCSMWCV